MNDNEEQYVDEETNVVDVEEVEPASPPKKRQIHNGELSDNELHMMCTL